MSPLRTYIDSQAAPVRELFEHIYATARRLAPNGTEGVSYAMPAYLVNNKAILAFAVTKNEQNLSLYPYSGRPVSELKTELDRAGHHYTTGSVHFSFAHPLSDELVERIIELRLSELG